MIYGYARVSTKGQAKDGNSLESQQAALKTAGAEKIYVDSFTGTKMNRPQFSELVDVLKPGDTLIVTKLDRFARSISQASDLITGQHSASQCASFLRSVREGYDSSTHSGGKSNCPTASRISRGPSEEVSSRPD